MLAEDWRMALELRIRNNTLPHAGQYASNEDICLGKRLEDLNKAAAPIARKSMHLFSFKGLGLAPLVLLALTTSAYGGDISPLMLPSQRQQSPITQTKIFNDKREQYYSDFRRDMSLKSPTERVALITEFEKKMKASRTEAESAHYQRLLDILSEIKN